jgi:hypothetical protein
MLLFEMVNQVVFWQESELMCFCSVKYVTAASVDHSQGKKVNREFLLLMEICPGGEDDLENSVLDPDPDSLNAGDPDLNAGDPEPYHLWCLVFRLSFLFISSRRYIVTVTCYCLYILEFCKRVFQNGRGYSRTLLKKVSKSLKGDLAKGDAAVKRCELRSHFCNQRHPRVNSELCDLKKVYS